jgi:hypothetical protein
VDNDKLLSIKEAAEILGCSVNSVRIYIDRTRRGLRRGIKFFQPGPWSPIRFKREWINQFIEENAQEPVRTNSKPALEVNCEPPWKLNLKQHSKRDRCTVPTTGRNGANR